MSRDIEKIKGLPKRIYLIIDEDEELEITEIAVANEVQWCEDDIYNEGLEYVRIDEVRKLQAENAELKKKYKGLRSTKEINQILTDWMREGVAKNRVFALQKAFEYSKQSEINLT